MPEVFPVHISDKDVSALLAELDGAKPYTDDDWKTACIDFEHVDLTITVRLVNGMFDASARERVALGIRALPTLHASVRDTIVKPDPPGTKDQHQLSWLDLYDDCADVGYGAISYNSTWEIPFELRDDGEWIRRS